MIRPQSDVRVSYRRFLVIEDDYIIAREMTRAFEALGAQVIGPAGSLGRALELAEAGEFDCALLDINLRGGDSYPVADYLMRRGLPFIFVSGYDRSIIPERYKNIPLIEKPIDAPAVARALAS